MQICKNCRVLNIGYLMLLLVVIPLFSSCYNENKVKIEKPSKFLNKTQMVNILTDIQIIEAGFTISEYKKDREELKPEYYNKVFKKYNITRLQFKQNINYYYNFPKIMENIYDQVLENLSKIQNNVIEKNKEIEEQRITDSIANLADTTEIIIDSTINTIDSTLQVDTTLN